MPPKNTIPQAAEAASEPDASTSRRETRQEKARAKKATPFHHLVADPRYLEVGASCRYVAILLWCGEMVPGTGLACLAPGAIETASVLTAEDLAPILRVLDEVELVTYHPKSRMIWLRGRSVMPPPVNRDVAIHAVARTHESLRLTSGVLPGWIHDAVDEISTSHEHWHVQRMQTFLAAINPVKAGGFGAPPEIRTQPAQRRFSAQTLLRGKLLATGKVAPDFELTEPPADAPPPDVSSIVAVMDGWDEMAARCGLNLAVRNRETVAAVRARLRSNSLLVFQKMIANVGVSPFLTGKVQAHERAPFRATLGWCCKASKFNLIIEGFYGDGTNRGAPRGSSASIVQGVRRAFDPEVDARDDRAAADRGDAARSR